MQDLGVAGRPLDGVASKGRNLSSCIFSRKQHFIVAVQRSGITRSSITFDRWGRKDVPTVRCAKDTYCKKLELSVVLWWCGGGRESLRKGAVCGTIKNEFGMIGNILRTFFCLRRLISYSNPVKATTLPTTKDQMGTRFDHYGGCKCHIRLSCRCVSNACTTFTAC